MVTILIVVIIVAIVIIMAGTSAAPPVDAGLAARTAVGLHRARRRLDAGILRTQMKSDAARVRREFDEELRSEP